MMTEPKIADRREQPYMGIRTLTTMQELPQAIQQGLGEVFGCLNEHGGAPAGPPFIRYHVINMAGQMDIELGVPVAETSAGDARVKPGVLPAGRYASLIYTGVQNGVPANGALLDWGAQQGLVWDRWDTAAGDAFRSRYESFLTDPAEEPDPAKWETEVAIMVAP